MSLIHTNRPRFSIEESQEMARELYGLEATAVSLPSYDDQNFRLTTLSGSEFVLKIASVDTAFDVLDLQNQAMIHLSTDRMSADGAKFCPRLCPTLDGEMMVEIADENGISFWVRLITFLPGKMLVDTQPHTPELLHEVGRFLGRLDRQFADFFHPAAHYLRDWNIKHAATTIRRYLHEVDDPERRALVERFLTRFETAVLPCLPHLRAQIIHNDGNDYNLIVSPDQSISIVDFGDVIHTVIVAEPAIAAAYIMLDKDDPVAAAAQLIDGYHAAHPLTELEIELLTYLAPIRICVSVVMSNHGQKLEPDNAYLAVTEKPGWEALTKLDAIPVSQIHDAFRCACGLPPSLNKAELLAARQKHLGPSLSVSYREPLKIVRGAGQFLYDEAERPYLDCVNNVCHVGHSHPR
ncbi:MAG: phosphotransferase, partial [Chloroflexi bacterium]|nr:phosphotransferase [Chloroflexota bacterium]